MMDKTPPLVGPVTSGSREFTPSNTKNIIIAVANNIAKTG
jgi:hypothetical protein